MIREPSKDKPIELEMSWLCQESKFMHSLVPSDIVSEANDLALAGLVGMMEISEPAGEEKAMEV